MHLFPCLALICAALAFADQPVVIGSKIFTESYILGETASQIVEDASSGPVERKPGMGSTGILFEALKAGSIDLYPDYTGTLAETILKKPKLKTVEQIREGLAPYGITISRPLGFNNTYALAVSEAFAEKHSLRTIGDLRAIAPLVRAAFSYEFMERKDGYRGLVARYRLPLAPAQVARMEHSLVYKAISEGGANVIEVYSTDANIKKFGLRVLADDLDYFPSYQAVWVARTRFVKGNPDAWQALTAYEGKISDAAMIEMNAQADLEKKGFAEIASHFLGNGAKKSSGRAAEIARRTLQHLRLVGVTVLFSLLVGLPLGIWASRSRLAGQSILLSSALIQTVPALALLSFLIPVFGIGLKPALVALCLYGLLPVVLNTFTGLRSVDRKHVENARAFGLSPWQILTRIELPLASPMILAGIKNSAIVSIGTATLAALIGAGGYGALIISGLSLNDTDTILAGALPAAGMALLAHLAFDLAARCFIPRGVSI
jgi:osmoprotectant transport system permease protein